MPQLISQLLQIFSGVFSVFLRLVLSMFPFYQQVDGLQTEFIAAAIGVPVIVVTAVLITIKVLKYFLKRTR